MKNRKFTKFINDNMYYMYGKHAVFAAISNPNRNIKKIYCLEKTSFEFKQKLAEHNVEVVSNDFINKKIGTNLPHQGIVAYVQSIFLKGLTDFKFTGSIDRVIIIDQITDPQNIGAIIRSAAAFGITKIILPMHNTPDENASIAKAASGYLDMMQVTKVTNLRSSIKVLKNMGFWTAGLAVDGKDEINRLLKYDKLAIVIGSEGKGMRRLTLESCDLLVRIPIISNVESLNASNAASIIFHALRIHC